MQQASNLGSVPRCLKQIQDLKYSIKPRDKSESCDRVHLLMVNELNSSKKQQFIRKVTSTADNYAICLYTDDMIDFMKKGCLARQLPSPIHVDTTYNLTSMFALVTTFRATEFEGAPLLIGPILLTKRVRMEDYNTLWQDLCSKDGLFKTAPLTFVTDGDDALIGSIRENFVGSRMLRCTFHLIDNVRRKLTELAIPGSVDVMGDMRKQLLFKTPVFQSSSTKMYTEWAIKAKDAGCSKQMDRFVSYYKTMVMPVVLQNMEEGKREIDQNINNNPAESMNATLKRWVGRKKVDVDELCQALKEGVLSQYEELHKGYLGLSHKYLSTSKVQVTRKTKATNLSDVMGQAYIIMSDSEGSVGEGSDIDELSSKESFSR